MHGLVFSELKKFVDYKLGPTAWNELLASAGLGNKFYMATQEYPDAEVVALVTAASQKTKIPANDLLEAFGEFITPSLLRMFGHLAKPSWRTLEFIENAEEAIHSVVRISNPGAKPPKLHVTRSGANEIVIHYTTACKIRALVKVIAKGVVRHNKESITLLAVKCMNKSGRRCEILLPIAAAASA